MTLDYIGSRAECRKAIERAAAHFGLHFVGRPRWTKAPVGFRDPSAWRLEQDVHR